jgi:chromosome partitioning protein
MKTIGFFNNKGGVGKTSLVYHVAWMLARQGIAALTVDLDPQANLTAMLVDDDRLEALWEASPKPTLHGAVSPQFRGIGDIEKPHVEHIADDLFLLVGDLELSKLEDQLSAAWPQCANGHERSFRDMSAFSRTIERAGMDTSADVALIDVGPNLGALNRAVLLGCDFIVVPLGADLFSLQGLRNMGPTIREWRTTWQRSRSYNPDSTLRLPAGLMRPAGYVVMRHSVQQGRPARAFSRWIHRIPGQYRNYILDDLPRDFDDVVADPHCLGILKDYRSLMPLAQEARKPMFLLKPADGAFGGHQAAVQDCWSDFDALTDRILKACDITPPL